MLDTEQPRITHMPLEHFKCKYYSGPVILAFSRYVTDPGRVAIIILTPQHEPLATATVNVSTWPLQDGYVILKGWSENEGIPQSMMDNKIVGPIEGYVPCGFSQGSIHKLLVDPTKLDPHE